MFYLGGPVPDRCQRNEYNAVYSTRILQNTGLYPDVHYYHGDYHQQNLSSVNVHESHQVTFSSSYKSLYLATIQHK